MRIIETVQEMCAWVKMQKDKQQTIGLIPTMGFLHEGHKSLIDRAIKENDIVVLSSFVNPTQFGKNEDYDSYPKNHEKDDILCAQSHVAVVFRPRVEEMYPEGFYSYVDVSDITEVLCGASRPGHFRGVCTVVSKLFGIIEPNKAYFGEKDIQQLIVVQTMVRDLNMNVEIVGCTIVREKDGLAMSSRNSYLDKEERQAAICLYRGLSSAKQELEKGQRETSVILDRICQEIRKEPLARIDYVEVVDRASLKPVTSIEKSIICAGAIFIGKTRLIDNLIWEC